MPDVHYFPKFTVAVNSGHFLLNAFTSDSLDIVECEGRTDGITHTSVIPTTIRPSRVYVTITVITIPPTTTSTHRFITIYSIITVYLIITTYINNITITISLLDTICNIVAGSRVVTTFLLRTYTVVPTDSIMMSIRMVGSWRISAMTRSREVMRTREGGYLLQALTPMPIVQTWEVTTRLTSSLSVRAICTISVWCIIIIIPRIREGVDVPHSGGYNGYKDSGHRCPVITAMPIEMIVPLIWVVWIPSCVGVITPATIEVYIAIMLSRRVAWWCGAPLIGGMY